MGPWINGEFLYWAEAAIGRKLYSQLPILQGLLIQGGIQGSYLGDAVQGTSAGIKDSSFLQLLSLAAGLLLSGFSPVVI